MTQLPPLIALVDEDPLYRDLMHELLTEEGYLTIVAPVDTDAYQIIRRERPALVILAIHMVNPDSGWLILERIRLDPTTTHIPVIVSSANSQLFRDSTALLKVMRCDTLQKPFSLDEILVKIATVIGPPTAR
jgi:DNA-binding response OmpR family regulator